MYGTILGSEDSDSLRLVPDELVCNAVGVSRDHPMHRRAGLGGDHWRRFS
jgi:hypothetical protein